MENVIVSHLIVAIELTLLGELRLAAMSAQQAVDNLHTVIEAPSVLERPPRRPDTNQG